MNSDRPRLVAPLASSPADEVRGLTSAVRALTQNARMLTSAIETCPHPAARAAAGELAREMRRLAGRLERSRILAGLAADRAHAAGR